MACSTEVQKGAIGTAFRVTIVDCDDVLIDVSTATVKTITFKDPLGNKVVQTANFYTNGTDGILEYISVSGDLDIVGTNWQIQGHVTLATGTWPSTIGEFSVMDNL